MKKLLKTIILASVLFMTGGYTYANAQSEFQIPKEDYDYFIKIGMSPTRIAMITPNEYRMLKEIEGEIVSSETKFYEVIEESDDFLKNRNSLGLLVEKNPVQKIVEVDENTYAQSLAEDYDNTLSTFAYSPGKVNKGKFTVNTYISKRSNKHFSTHTSTVWKSMPTTRGKDVIGATINPSFWKVKKGTNAGKQIYTQTIACNKTESKEISYSNTSSNWSRGASGYALTINIPKNAYTGTTCGSIIISDLVSFVAAEVEALASSKSLDVYGHYSHQKLSLGLTPSISFTGVSIAVSPSLNFDTASNHAVYSW